jgi:hypothetical protein
MTFVFRLTGDLDPSQCAEIPAVLQLADPSPGTGVAKPEITLISP